MTFGKFPREGKGGTLLETFVGLDSDYSTTLHALSHSVLYHPCEVGIRICLQMRCSSLLTKIATIITHPVHFPPTLILAWLWDLLWPVGQQQMWLMQRLESCLHTGVSVLTVLGNPSVNRWTYLSQPAGQQKRHSQIITNAPGDVESTTRHVSMAILNRQDKSLRRPQTHKQVQQWSVTLAQLRTKAQPTHRIFWEIINTFKLIFFFWVFCYASKLTDTCRKWGSQKWNALEDHSGRNVGSFTVSCLVSKMRFIREVILLPS